MKILRVVDWNLLYENNRTRELKRLDWVPVPNKQDGDGYTLLVERPDGAAMLGAWLVILQIASKCEPRGVLIRSGTIPHPGAAGCGSIPHPPAVPHDSASIARISRLPEKIIKASILVLLSECKWLEEVEVQCETKNPAPDCGNPAPDCGKVPMEWKGMEGKGNIYCPASRTLIFFLNEQTGAKFRETDSNLKFIHSRLQEPGVDLAGCQAMIIRQVKMWKGTSMAKYLRPETLFNKTKFDSYYAAKDLPIETDEPARPKKLGYVP